MAVRCDADGEWGYISSPADTGDATAIIWCRSDAASEAWSNVISYLNGLSSASEYAGIQQSSTTEVLRAYNQSNTATLKSTPDFFDTSNWGVFAIRWDQSTGEIEASCRMLEGTDASIAPTHVSPAFNTALNFSYISFMSDSYPSAGHLNGACTNLKVWSRYLTDDEVFAEMTQFMPVQWNDLHAWCPMRNSTDTQDLSGNGNTVTWNGTVSDDGNNPPTPWQAGAAARQTRVLGPPQPIIQEADHVNTTGDATIGSAPADDVLLFLQYARDGGSVAGDYPTEAGTGTYVELANHDEQLASSDFRFSAGAWYLESTGSGEDLAFGAGTDGQGSYLLRLTPPAGVTLDWANRIVAEGVAANNNMNSVTTAATAQLGTTNTITAQGTDVQGQGVGQDTCSTTHTLVAGTDRVIIAVLNGEVSQPKLDTTGFCTYGGVAMKFIGEAKVDPGFANTAAVFMLLEDELPADGAHTVSADYDCNTDGTHVDHTNDMVTVQVMQFEGVEQVYPTGGAIQTATAQSSAATETHTFTGGESGDLYIVAMSLGEANTVTFGGDETITELWDTQLSATFTSAVGKVISNGTIGDITATPSASTNRVTTIAVRFKASETPKNYWSIACSYRKDDNNNETALRTFDQGHTVGQPVFQAADPQNEHLAAVDTASFNCHYAVATRYGPFAGTPTLTAKAHDAGYVATGILFWILVPESTAGVTLEQKVFRFRSDGTEGEDGAPTTWAAAEDTNLTGLAKNTPRGIRITINATGDPATDAYKVRWRKTGGTYEDLA